jgi:hypothetical protein
MRYKASPLERLGARKEKAASLFFSCIRRCCHRIRLQGFKASRLQGFKASRLPLTESEGKPYAEKKSPRVVCLMEDCAQTSGGARKGRGDIRYEGFYLNPSESFRYSTE